MKIKELIEFHEKRKERAEKEGLLGTLTEEVIIIDKLEKINIKQR